MPSFMFSSVGFDSFRARSRSWSLFLDIPVLGERRDLKINFFNLFQTFCSSELNVYKGLI